MKIIFNAWLLLISAIAAGQENFIPSRPENVSESDYRTGQWTLKNSYQQLAEHNYELVAIDYWNFATAYHKMGQPKEMIYDFLFKSRITDKNKFCEIALKYHELKKEVDSVGFYKLLGNDYKELVADCSKIITKEAFDIDDYIKKNKFDKELIYQLNELLEADQKFRNENFKEKLNEQTKADELNMIKAEETINKYGYPGKTMAGNKFDHVIWIVIQHSSLIYQEKYLPLIAKAVEQKELGKTPLRMLLDRIYAKKTGSQIFGSQIGLPFSDNKTIEEVKLKYNL